MQFIRPRWVFGVYLTLCIVFIGPAINHYGNVGVSMLFVTLFFESVCFPTIVALGMRGLGRHTKRGSGFIVGGVVGGACVPPLTGVAADTIGTGRAMVVPLVFFVAAWSYAITVNFVPRYRDIADAFTVTEVGLRGPADAESVVGSAGVVQEEKEKTAKLEHDQS